MHDCNRARSLNWSQIHESLKACRDRNTPQAAADVVDDTDVLELLLAPVSTPGDDRIAAGILVSTFGGLSAVLGASLERLAECVGWEMACHLGLMQFAFERVLRERVEGRLLVGSWNDLELHLLASLRHATIEQLRILFLDRKNGLIREEVMQQGTVDHVPTYPREIAKRALELDASAVIMVHNHPSGDPSPSRTDVEMTKQVMAALSPLGIALHDHAVVGRNEVVSLRGRQLI